MTRLVAGCIGVLAVALAAIVRPEIRVLLFGWFAFLRGNLSRVTVNPTTVATSLAFVVVLLALAQYVGWWWCRSRDGQASSLRWRFRSSLAVLAVLFLMFAVALSTVGLARQVGWLLSSDAPIYVEQVEYFIRAGGLGRHASQAVFQPGSRPAQNLRGSLDKYACAGKLR